MYFDKLRITPHIMWRALTFSACILLIHQDGPAWIHRMHRICLTENQIAHKRITHRILSIQPKRFAKDLRVTETWLSVHGIEIPGQTRMKDSSQKWKDIFFYWKGYQ